MSWDENFNRRDNNKKYFSLFFDHFLDCLFQRNICGWFFLVKGISPSSAFGIFKNFFQLPKNRLCGLFLGYCTHCDDAWYKISNCLFDTARQKFTNLPKLITAYYLAISLINNVQHTKISPICFFNLLEEKKISPNGIFEDSMKSEILWRHKCGLSFFSSECGYQ